MTPGASEIAGSRSAMASIPQARNPRIDALFFHALAAKGPQDWLKHESLYSGLSNADWQDFMGLAERHGMIGLLARSLGWAQQSSNVSVPFCGRLELARRSQLVQHLFRRSAARRVMNTFLANGISVVPFKGIVLAEELYGDLSLRGFRDADILVPRIQLPEAFELARNLDYRPVNFESLDDHLRLRFHAIQMIHPDGTGLDLHWSIDPDFLGATELEIIWQSLEPAQVGAYLPGQRLSPELCMIQLAKHFHTHQYLELKPLIDFHIARQTLARTISNGRLSELARQLGVSPIIAIANALCDRHLTPVPPSKCVGYGSVGLRGRLAQSVLSREVLLRSGHLSRRGNFFRFLLTAGTFRYTMKSALRSLVPGRRELERRFAKPFTPSMYIRFYSKQLRMLVSGTRQTS